MSKEKKEKFKILPFRIIIERQKSDVPDLLKSVPGRIVTAPGRLVRLVASKVTTIGGKYQVIDNKHLPVQC